MESIDAIEGKRLNLCSILRFGRTKVILLRQQNYCVDCEQIIFVVDLLFQLLHICAFVLGVGFRSLHIGYSTMLNSLKFNHYFQIKSLKFDNINIYDF